VAESKQPHGKETIIVIDQRIYMGRCELSGVRTTECREVWEIDDEHLVVKLVGMQALCPEIKLAKNILRQPNDKRHAAMQTLMAMNK